MLHLKACLKSLLGDKSYIEFCLSFRDFGEEVYTGSWSDGELFKSVSDFASNFDPSYFACTGTGFCRTLREEAMKLTHDRTFIWQGQQIVCMTIMRWNLIHCQVLISGQVLYGWTAVHLAFRNFQMPMHKILSTTEHRDARDDSCTWNWLKVVLRKVQTLLVQEARVDFEAQPFPNMSSLETFDEEDAQPVELRVFYSGAMSPRQYYSLRQKPGLYNIQLKVID